MKIKSKYLFKSSRKSNYKKSLNPKPIDTKNARILYLPKLKLERKCRTEERIKQNWGVYWDKYYRGLSHYNRKWYQKAKEEFLKISNWHHSSDAYFTHLIRT